jgi:hypothetical protein
MTDRDKAIIRAVYTHRALTRPQIEDLLFPPDNGQSHRTKTSRARHRLKLLYQHGYLFRDQQPTKTRFGSKPLVYFIDKKSVPLLADELGVFPEDIDWHPRNNNVGWMFLDHLLATNDVRIAIEVAAENKSLKLSKWSDEKTLKSREMRDSVVIVGPNGSRIKASIVPDGHFCLEGEDSEYHHFLEVDMGTETGLSSKFGRRDFSRKIRGYIAYWKHGLYQKKYDPQHQHDNLPMWVLTITTGPKRLANLKAVAESAGAHDSFYFTTFDRVVAKSVLTEPIWEIAGFNGHYPLLQITGDTGE